MLQRFISIADEQARWEAEERERQRLEKAESRKRLSETGEEGPPERPLMIRTGKAKTEGGAHAWAGARWGWHSEHGLGA